MEKLVLSDGSYSVLDYSRLLWIYLKKHGEKTDNPPMRTYVNKTENRIIFKIKTGYHLELLTPEIMKLPGSIKNKLTKEENGKSVPHLEITNVVLVHCNIVNNDYEEDSRVLYTFVPNKSFAQLLDISPKHFILLKTFDVEISYIEVWFTDQNSKPLEI